MPYALRDKKYRGKDSSILMNTTHKKNKGFTLAELMIVILIIGLITALALPGYSQFLQSWKLNGEAEQFASALRTARSAAVMRNLDAVFTNELNMRERYLACARQADAEGFAAVARLFRACARSEQIHADRHVQAIAWMGGEAKAMLGQLGIAGTADNLRTAIELERYESTELYPALIARARTDRQAMAVRSMTFALAAEREHLALLTEALTRLEQRPAAPAFHVCSYCGKTVTVLDSRKCPHCFTPASRFAVVE